MLQVPAARAEVEDARAEDRLESVAVLATAEIESEDADRGLVAAPQFEEFAALLGVGGILAKPVGGFSYSAARLSRLRPCCVTTSALARGR